MTKTATTTTKHFDVVDEHGDILFRGPSYAAARMFIARVYPTASPSILRAEGSTYITNHHTFRIVAVEA